MSNALRKTAAAVLLAALLGGCAGQQVSPPAGGSASAPPTLGALVPTTAPDVMPTATPNPDVVAATVDGWLYYLDEEDAATVNYGEDPPLRRRSEAGADEALGLRGFSFDIIGTHLYLDSSYPDLDEDGKLTWYTTRMSLDGSQRRRLEYGSMSARLVPEGAQQFYFTVAGDSAVYVSDLACEAVKVLPIALPDEAELGRKLGSSKEMQLDIDGVADGKVAVIVIFVTYEGIQMYKGTYRIAEDGSGTEKAGGTYYDYKSQQNALN